MCEGQREDNRQRILVIVRERMRTENGQQTAQEDFVFQSQTQGSTDPCWGAQGFLYESSNFSISKSWYELWSSPQRAEPDPLLPGEIRLTAGQRKGSLSLQHLIDTLRKGSCTFIL